MDDHTPNCVHCGTLIGTATTPAARHLNACCHSGLKTKRHHEVNHFISTIASQVYNNVEKEVVVRERVVTVNGDGNEEVTAGLRADLTIRSLWQPQEVAFLDIRVIDSDAASHVAKPVADVLKLEEEKKLRKYKDACAAMGGSFTPFVVTADGVLAPQADKLVTQLAQRLCERPNSLVNASYSETLNWLHTRLQFAIVRAASLVLRAPKKNYPRPISFEEGRAVMPSWLYRDY